MRRHRAERARVLALILTPFAVIIVGWLVLTGGDGYTVNARFIDAAQLVKGDLVEVSGRPIGIIDEIRLTDQNQAEVVMTIDDERYDPLHEGTRAVIRSVGLSGIANRFVELSPGPDSNPAIPDDGVLDTSATTPLVDLDLLLNALDEPTRDALQSVIRQSAAVLDTDTAAKANEFNELLNPAFTQASALGAELARDTAAVETLLTAGADVATTLAERSDDLQQGVANTATTLRAIASQGAELESVLAKAPPVLSQAQGTLTALNSTLTEVTPVVRELQPSAQPLADLVRATPSASRKALPIIADLRDLVPELEATLEAAPGLAGVAVPAIRSSTSSLTETLPVVQGLRPYSFDFVQGLSNGFGATTAGYYDANGHFARISAHTAQPAIAGLPPLIPPIGLPGTELRTGLLARCPGGAVEPASDKSNPWIPDPSLCDPSHDHLPEP